MRMYQGDTFILESEELAMLLQARGLRRFQGFPLTKIPKDREEILLTTKKLTEKGFLVSDGEAFHVDSEISACIALLEKSQGVLLVNPAREAVPQRFLYPGEQIVVCQPVPFKDGAVKIRRMNWEELGEFTREQGRKSGWQYYRKGEAWALWSFMITLSEDEKLEIQNHGESRELDITQMGEFMKHLIFDIQDKE